MQTGALAPGNATPGRVLAAARTERGMSVSEVAQRLKFSTRHIEALESDRYDSLPSGPFVRGMIRTYAKLLGVDPGPLLDDLPRPGAAGEPEMQPRDMSVPFPQDARSGSRVYLLLSMLIIVAVTVVLAEWFIRSQRDAPLDAPLSAPAADPGAKVEALPEPVPLSTNASTQAPQRAMEESLPQRVPETALVPPASPSAASPSRPAAAAPPPALTTASPAAERTVAKQANAAESAREAVAATELVPPGRARLMFTFDVESWVEITDANGKVLLSAINPAGTEKNLVGTAPFSMVIGNASGVRLTYNGKPVELAPHRSSDVARLTLE